MVIVEERLSSGTTTTSTATATTATHNAVNKMIQNNMNNAELTATNHTTQSAQNNNGTSIPKCFCTWKNCRAYQKAWRESNHTIYDGVIKIKFIKGHYESMALKSCIDRILAIPETKANEWKPAVIPSTNNGSETQQQSTTSTPEYTRYIIARHHFTEKHILKYMQDPKTFSFLKPFSVHGATKYLYSLNRLDTFQSKDGHTENNNDDDQG